MHVHEFSKFIIRVLNLNYQCFVSPALKKRSTVPDLYFRLKANKDDCVNEQSTQQRMVHNFELSMRPSECIDGISRNTQ